MMFGAQRVYSRFQEAGKFKGFLGNLFQNVFFGRKILVKIFGVINKQTQPFLKHCITNVSIFCFILLLQSERSERAAT